MLDVLEIYFYVKGELENSEELKQFFYHGWLHTKSFYDAVCYLAPLECVNIDDAEKLKIAALYHDRGYKTGKEDHEYQSVIIARLELPSFGISEPKIDEICRLIMSTVPSHRPFGILEEIMHDADYEYIGRDYYMFVSELLRKELGIEYSVWKVEQIKFLSKHKFLTSSARLIFDVQKNINYMRLLNDV